MYSTEDNSTTTEFESGSYDSPTETEDTAELYNGVIDDVQPIRGVIQSPHFGERLPGRQNIIAMGRC